MSTKIIQSTFLIICLLFSVGTVYMQPNDATAQQASPLERAVEDTPQTEEGDNNLLEQASKQIAKKEESVENPTLEQKSADIYAQEEKQTASRETDQTPDEQLTYKDGITHEAAFDAAESGVYLSSFLEPWDFGDPHQLIDFDFEEAELLNIIRFIENKFDITFILDDAFNPVPPKGKSLKGTKISFRTNDPLSKKEAWNIFLTFLDIGGAGIRPGPNTGTYRVTTIDPGSPLAITKDPLPTFVGTNWKALPSNDTYVRYVYYVKNTSLDLVKSVMDAMKSQTAPGLIPIPEVRGMMITDKAYNIKAIMAVVDELDQVTMPETLSIIKLRHADASKVAALYQELIKGTEKSDQTLAQRLLGNRKEQTINYFPPGTRIIPEPRTNTLIVLGTQTAVEKIENFIKTNIDKESDVPYKPLHVVTLKYVEAEATAKIINEVIKFQPETEAAKVGGVRGGDQYFQGVSIVPEKSGNRLIITADYDAYIKIYDIIQKIDIEQPQIAMKVLILAVEMSKDKEIGSQIRSKKPGVDNLLGDNTNFQTSGLLGQGVVENTQGTGATRLLGDLVTLATQQVGAGATFLTLGSDQFGVWGLFRLLDSYVQTNIISNPFLVTANKYPAKLSVGETRRVPETNITTAAGPTTQSFENLDANLEVIVTPQISYEGLITLEITIKNNQFTGPSGGPQAGDRVEREIKNAVIVANNEVVALGGLVQNTFSENESRVPVLGKIPVLGWLFKNKIKDVRQSSILVLISPEILPTDNLEVGRRYTQTKIDTVEDTIASTQRRSEDIDPINRWFFNDSTEESQALIDEFAQKEGRYLREGVQDNPTGQTEDLGQKAFSEYFE
jgi:general secretion pathway protein D